MGVSACRLLGQTSQTTVPCGSLWPAPTATATRRSTSSPTESPSRAPPRPEGPAPGSGNRSSYPEALPHPPPPHMDMHIPVGPLLGQRVWPRRWGWGSAPLPRLCSSADRDQASCRVPSYCPQSSAAPLPAALPQPCGKAVCRPSREAGAPGSIGAQGSPRPAGPPPPSAPQGTGRLPSLWSSVYCCPRLLWRRSRKAGGL